MSDVALFYEDLQQADRDFTTAFTSLHFDAANLVGGDPGVAAPLGRYHLMSCMDRGIGKLKDAAIDGWTSASAIADSVSAIASAYSALDDELAGTGTP
ncbi:hypothetical protein [Microbacterium sp. XT11]|uniref:hypothetical protein n=1 Tax=Microbacterium sp. XT11 TaxID=367477 RepID=UPI000833674F|nr:hypothetical protein [Microbacterium sp. XT11]